MDRTRQRETWYYRMNIIKNKKPIFGFYHIAMMNYYKRVVKEQVERIIESGLYEDAASCERRTHQNNSEACAAWKVYVLPVLAQPFKKREIMNKQNAMGGKL